MPYKLVQEYDIHIIFSRAVNHRNRTVTQHWFINKSFRLIVQTGLANLLKKDLSKGECQWNGMEFDAQVVWTNFLVLDHPRLENKFINLHLCATKEKSST